MLLLSVPVYAFNERFSLQIDITYDGEPEEIVYEVTGESWERPITWSFTIHEKGKVIFRYVVENENNLAHFEEPGYMQGCSGLAHCQEEWFINQAFESMLVTVEKSNVAHGNILKMFLIIQTFALVLHTKSMGCIINNL